MSWALIVAKSGGFPGWGRNQGDEGAARTRTSDGVIGGFDRWLARAIRLRSCLVVGGEAAHGHRQASWIERLGEVHGVAGGPRALLVRFHGVGGEGKGRHGAALAVPDLAHELEAVQPRHAEIADED